MGKNKKRKRGHETTAPAAAAAPPPATTEPIALRAVDVATTIDTLNYLATRPELLEHKALRELRAALHPIVEAQLHKFDPIDYVSRVTAALRTGRGADALQALQGLHARQQEVKQGTVQRWVRDSTEIADAGLRVKLLHSILRAGKAPGGDDGSGGEEEAAAASGGEVAEAEDGREEEEAAAEEEAEEVEEEGAEEQEIADAAEEAEGMSATEHRQPSDSVAATTATFSSAIGGGSGGGGGGSGGGGGGGGGGGEGVTVLPPWVPHDTSDDLSATLASAAASNGATASLLTPSSAAGATREQLGIRIVMTERGGERQPPNHHDLNIFACEGNVRILAPASSNPPPSVGGTACGNMSCDGVLGTPLHAASSRGTARRVDVPGVPGAFVLLNILSREECATLSCVAEAMGYTPDHPLSRPAPSGIEACEWLLGADTAEALLARCRPHLPPELRGGRLAGINARCRFFRYTDAEQAVYRPHIDGSWPGSGLDPISGSYVHDAFGDRRSRLTFLMYLNDGFDGGCTTFYLPASSGGLRARGVKPRAGSVLCFPQGNTASLLHEGSAVTRGTKDVIRTDVLYHLATRD